MILNNYLFPIQKWKQSICKPKQNDSWLVFIMISIVLSILMVTSSSSVVDNDHFSLQQADPEYTITISDMNPAKRTELIGLTFTSTVNFSGISIHVASFTTLQPCSDTQYDNIDESDLYSSKIATSALYAYTEPVTLIIKRKATSTGKWSIPDHVKCAIDSVTFHVYKDRKYTGNALTEPGTLIYSPTIAVTLPPLYQNLISSPRWYQHYTSVIRYLYVDSPDSRLIIEYDHITEITDNYMTPIRIHFSTLIRTCEPFDTIALIGTNSKFDIPYSKIIEVCSPPATWSTVGATDVKFTLQVLLDDSHPYKQFSAPVESIFRSHILVKKFLDRTALLVSDPQTGANSSYYGLPMSINTGYIGHLQVKSTENFKFSCDYTPIPVLINESQSHFPTQQYPFTATITMNQPLWFKLDQHTTELSYVYPDMDGLSISTDANFQITACWIYQHGYYSTYYPAQYVPLPEKKITYIQPNQMLHWIYLQSPQFGSDFIFIGLGALPQNESYQGIVTVNGTCIVSDPITGTHIVKTFESVPFYTQNSASVNGSIEWSVVYNNIVQSVGYNNILHLYDVYLTWDITIDAYTSLEAGGHLTTIHESISSPKYSLCSSGLTGPTCRQSGCALQSTALNGCYGHGIVEYNTARNECASACTCDNGYFGQDCRQKEECINEYNTADRCSGHGYINISTDTSTCDTICTCDIGWYGPTCSLPGLCLDQYNQLNQCNGRGRVVQNSIEGKCANQCTCDVGWTGIECEKAQSCTYAKLDTGLSCTGPLQQWSLDTTSDCKAECVCRSDGTIESNCYGHGELGFNTDGQCQCICEPGRVGRYCEYSGDCQDQMEDNMMCSGHGTITYDDTSQACPNTCQCDPLWQGALCQQSKTCLESLNSFNCGQYGYATTYDDTIPNCTRSCVCSNLWQGNLCHQCPIKCYNNGTYNNANRCREDADSAPPCLCTPSGYGRYCQFLSRPASLALGRVLKPWLVSAIDTRTSNPAFEQLISDLTNAYAAILFEPSTDPIISSLGESVKRIRFPVNYMSYKKLSCSPDDEPVASTFSFTVIVYATALQEWNVIDAKMNTHLDEISSVTRAVLAAHNFVPLQQYCFPAEDDDDDDDNENDNDSNTNNNGSNNSITPNDMNIARNRRTSVGQKDNIMESDIVQVNEGYYNIDDDIIF